MSTTEQHEVLEPIESYHPVVELMMSNNERRLQDLRQKYDVSPDSPGRLQAVQTMRNILSRFDEAICGYSGPEINVGEIDLVLDGLLYGPDPFCYRAHTVDQIVDKLTIIPFRDDEVTDYERLTEVSKYAQLTYFDKTMLRASDMAKMALCVHGLCTPHDAEARETIIETAKDLYPAIALRAISYRSSTVAGKQNSKEFFRQMADLSLKVLEDSSQSADFFQPVDYLYQQGDHRIMTQIAYFLGKELNSDKPSAEVVNYLFDTYCRVLHNTGGVVSDTCGSDVKPAFVIGLRWSNTTIPESINTLLSFVNKGEWGELTHKLGLEPNIQPLLNGEVTSEKVISTCVPGMFATVLGKATKDRVAVFFSHDYQLDFVRQFSAAADIHSDDAGTLKRSTSPHKYIDEEGHIEQQVIDDLRASEKKLLVELTDAVFIQELTEQELALLNIAKAALAKEDELAQAKSLALGKALHIVSAGHENGIFTTPYKLVRSKNVTGIIYDANGNLFGFATVDGEIVNDPKELLHKAGLPKAAESYLKEGD